MLGRARGVFKVNVWKHKGLGTVCAKRFACVDPTFVDLDAPVPTPTVEGAPVRSGVPAPTPREWLALGAGYRNALSLAQLSSHHIVQSLLLIIRRQQAHIVQQNGTIIRLGGEHQKLYGTTARTLTDIAELKIGLVELGLDRRDEAQRSAATAEIGRQFVTELGGLGRVYLSSKLGLDPDLTEILTIVSDDERLVATLKDPAVREMLKDEATRKELALMLQLAAAKHKAQAGASTPRPTTAPPRPDRARSVHPLSEETTVPETPTPVNRPRWARAVELFAGRAFDVKSTREFASPFSWNTGAEYASLSAGERDYYRDHLLYRQAQALEGIDARLARLLDQGDRDGRTLAVGFRGALELLEEIAGDDGAAGSGDEDPDPAGEAAGEEDVDELGDDEPVEPDEVWIGPDGGGAVEREVIDAEAEVVRRSDHAGADDSGDDALRDAVEGGEAA